MTPSRSSSGFVEPPDPQPPVWRELTAEDIAALTYESKHPTTVLFIRGLAKGLNRIAAEIVRELKNPTSSPSEL